MKTLSIRQPWANLIVHGIKDVENRTWRTNYRGRVLVHAPVKVGDVDFNFQQKQYIRVDFLTTGRSVSMNSPVSAIIGSVEIYDCVRDSRSAWAEPDVWHWLLRNPVVFDQPITGVSGKLSFWEYDFPGGHGCHRDGTLSASLPNRNEREAKMLGNFPGGYEVCPTNPFKEES